jgi:Zn-dependent M28 family amino/carboxypeptidase
MHLQLDCKTLPDTLQYNVVAEYRGTDKDAGTIIIGGHLDAWETGDGAHDDGAGCAHSVEVMHLVSHQTTRPRHTLRVVMFINEENGLRGGLAMADWVKTHHEHIAAAIETDAGGFTPRGFEFGCKKELYKNIELYKYLFKLYGCDDWDWSAEGSGGADVGPLKGATPLLIEFRPDSQRYFDVHHAATDNISSVSPRELEMGACCIAALFYVLDKTGVNLK